tara:strand:- start:852 stop:1025 length:174 start_codon:yes stop_codon:yes gene_type:complete
MNGAIFMKKNVINWMDYVYVVEKLKIKETNPEKLKEWRHQAYLNRKAKLNALKINEV